jgi:hypothetical protein
VILDSEDAISKHEVETPDSGAATPESGVMTPKRGLATLKSKDATLSSCAVIPNAKVEDNDLKDKK